MVVGALQAYTLGTQRVWKQVRFIIMYRSNICGKSAKGKNSKFVQMKKPTDKPLRPPEQMQRVFAY